MDHGILRIHAGKSVTGAYPVGAQHGFAVAAVSAVAAALVMMHRYSVANRKVLYIFADGMDNAGTLMTTGRAIVVCGAARACCGKSSGGKQLMGCFDHVPVRAADGSGLDLDNHIIGTGLGNGILSDSGFEITEKI